MKRIPKNTLKFPTPSKDLIQWNKTHCKGRLQYRDRHSLSTVLSKEQILRITMKCLLCCYVYHLLNCILHLAINFEELILFYKWRIICLCFYFIFKLQSNLWSCNRTENADFYHMNWYEAITSRVDLTCKSFYAP